jgi:hypothetical protein
MTDQQLIFAVFLCMDKNMSVSAGTTLLPFTENNARCKTLEPVITSIMSSFTSRITSDNIELFSAAECFFVTGTGSGGVTEQQLS